jgi:hypothetical protein
MNARQIVSRILYLKQGWEIRHPLVCDTVAQHIEIRSDTSFTYTMDGDFYECGGLLDMTMGPAIRYVHV